MQKSTIASIMLIIVTAMWGLTFPLIHEAIVFLDPGSFVAIRMILATLVLLPFVISRFRYTNRFLIIGCLLLALLNTATYIFQTKGLATIPAARSAFITGASVIMVPLLMPFFRLGKPDKLVFASVSICLMGLYILTGADLRHLTIGDFWTLDCAISYAFFIIVMQIMSTRAKDYLLLCFFQVAFSVFFALPFATVLISPIILKPIVLITLIFCSVFATVIAIYLQGRYQQYVTAAKTALIFALEPVFATIFAYFINVDSVIAMHTVIGGLLILISILLRDFMLFYIEKKHKK